MTDYVSLNELIFWHRCDIIVSCYCTFSVVAITGRSLLASDGRLFRNTAMRFTGATACYIQQTTAFYDLVYQ